MKILLVSNLYPPTVIGGYELSCAQVVDELRRRGHDVRVLTSVPRQLVDDPEDHVLRTMRHPDSFFLADRPDTHSNFWELEANLIDSGNVYALVSALRTFRPDVCYLWNLIGLGGIALVGALEVLGVPWVWHLGDAVPAFLAIFEGKVLPLAREMSTRLTGRFVAVSQGLVNEVEHSVILGDRVRLVPNWVVETGEVLKRNYFSGGTLRIVFAGRVVEEKGIFVLLEALRLLREGQVENLHLDVIGTGQLDEVRRMVMSLGLDRHVDLKGWLPQSLLRQELRSYDVFAFPTHAREAFAIAPLEAAAAGCVPVITTPSGPAEWLVDGIDCLKAPRDAAAFAAVIGAVCRGEIDLAPVGRRGAGVVRRDFVLQRVVPVFEEELHRAARPYAPVQDEGTVYEMAVIAEAIARSAVASGGDYLEG